MIRTRRAAREAALLILFAAESARMDTADEALELYRRHLEGDAEVTELLVVDGLPPEVNPPSDHWGFVERVVLGTVGHRQAIDDLISRCSEHWKVSRMGRVDRNVLRLAGYELIFERNVPMRVTLNEGIELAKRFGTEDSGAFVNGILDRMARELDSESGGQAEP